MYISYNNRMSKRGRPSKWTEETRRLILSHIENGATYKRACLLSGISHTIYWEWRKQGQKDRENGEETEFTDFLEEIERAKEKYIAWLQQAVNRQVKKDGRLALDVLQRLRPKEFGKQVNVQSNSNVNINKEERIELEQTIKLEVSDEQDAEVLRVLLEAGAFDERVKDLLKTETNEVHSE